MRQTFFAPAVIGAWLVVSAATAADDPFRYYKAGLSTDVWGLAESTSAPWSTDFKDQPSNQTGARREHDHLSRRPHRGA